MIPGKGRWVGGGGGCKKGWGGGRGRGGVAGGKIEKGLGGVLRLGQGSPTSYQTKN